MAAILGVPFERVVEICHHVEANGIVVAANWNAEKQVVISGTKAGIEAASAIASEHGAKRVIPLAVGGAFHSPLMRPSPDRLKPVLDGLRFTDGIKPVVLNVTAEPTTSAKIIKSKLIEQLTAPVLWYPSLASMKKSGATTVIEIGPKKVLLGLAKGVLDNAQLLSLDTVGDLETWAGNPAPA
jgi:[acyl-carrier-protein] S-malonyltransferase